MLNFVPFFTQPSITFCHFAIQLLNPLNGYILFLLEDKLWLAYPLPVMGPSKSF